MKNTNVLLFLIMIFLGSSIFTVRASSENLLSQKTDADLYQKIVRLDDKELIDVYIWKQSIDEEAYRLELLSYGFDETIYGNEEAFQKNIVSNLQEFGKNNRIREIREEYKTARRKAIKSVTIESNQKFLIDNGLQNNDVIRLSSYTSTIIVSLTKRDALRVVEDDRTLGLSLFKNELQSSSTNKSVDQINAGDSSGGLRAAGYDGSGVTIGIIEAESGRFDPDSPMLSDLVTSGQLEFIEVDGVSEDISDHATHVTNIIVGESYSVFPGLTVEGIATGAQVYQSAIADKYDVYVAFDQFVDLGADIINYSGGHADDEYTAYDQEIDRLIYWTKVLFVVSAGNSGDDIDSPAKAYNAITVGSVDTKTSYSTSDSSPYDVSSFSSYEVDSYLSNKPEIVAPGRFITTMIETGLLPHFNSGTSFSAPHVASVLAQLVEKYGSSVNSNNYVTYFKGRLMLGADSTKVNDTSHRTGDSSIFHDESGAGFLNAFDSAKTIYGWNKRIKTTLLDLNYYVNITLTSSSDYDIRAVLIFEKPENVLLTSNYGNNLNLYLEDENNQTIESSTSTTNIFETLEGTIPANEGARLRVHRTSYINTGYYISFSCFWMYI